MGDTRAVIIFAMSSHHLKRQKCADDDACNGKLKICFNSFKVSHHLATIHHDTFTNRRRTPANTPDITSCTMYSPHANPYSKTNHAPTQRNALLVTTSSRPDKRLNRLSDKDKHTGLDWRNRGATLRELPPVVSTKNTRRRGKQGKLE